LRDESLNIQLGAAQKHDGVKCVARIGWIALTALVLIAAFLKAPQFPTNDPALFEYYGQHLLRGQHLYVDLWDNKLPSIYLVNELWQRLFGTHYAWHLVVEMLINTGSVVLFSALLRRYELASRPWATFCFAAILVLPPAAYDYTEFYALPLILGALLLVDSPLAAGACIALAATFWLPSVLVGVVICWQRGGLSRIGLFAAGVLAVAVPYGAAFIYIMGAHVVEALAATWPAYIRHGSASLTVSRLAWLRALYAPIIISGAGAALAAFLAFIRRPDNDAQRLAIGWICATVIGGAIPGNASFHHFVPSLAALVFGIAAFAGVPFERRTLLPRMLAGLAAVVLLSTTVRSMVSQVRDITGLSRSAQTIGACVERAFGSNATIYVAEFAPELYLAADAAPGNPFAMVDPMLDMTQRTGAHIRSPRVFIALAGDQAPPAYELRYIAEPWWRVYTKPHDALECG
jgi:hypothetical protein